ncbi:N-acetylmuramoyl-L-alanine amidase family protein [Paenibacillus wynnii]|uniref:N-acetylmuramoyl-L-alanine amidase n=1 Tax=Paenibacillus wynnii TaxID=268407 RepID=A0A098M2N1_9BACL|nr:N-acetylmuramoyl-L-alanine amidase [Paenibacillus wynnii]KGE16236.1 N-acetylmuramoyl-L-alanine amidase [Paenibacillus wynnii]KGE21102.1 N-acetylmuramoyl-L-alanine amidase [Paenibacillus wynnii]
MIKDKYPIERRYIDKRHSVRPGTRLTSGTPGFLVAHDTGNPGASADNHFTYFQNLKDRSASAQVFIDDKKILEIIPTGTGPDPAEKAWHVLYNVITDNKLFGDDANDIALGVELCYGGKIVFEEAYKRFVWYMAYCCDKWGLNPLLHIPSHKQLDPSRKRDIDQALKTAGKTLKDLLYDVAAEMQEQPIVIVAPAAIQLPAVVAQLLIDNYVSPAWFEAHKAGDAVGATHFHNLADNLRMAACMPLQPGAKAPFKQLPKSNAQELIFRWLSSGWQGARIKGDKTAMAYFNNRANHLRRAAGMPIE